MKGKTKQRVMAVVLTLVMTISLLPLEFLGGGVTQVKAAGGVFNPSSVGAKTYSSQINEGIFTIYPAASGTAMSINSNSRSYDGVDYIMRFQFQGTATFGDSPARAVGFSVENGNATLTIIGQTGSNNSERFIVLTKPDGTTEEKSIGSDSGASGLVKIEFEGLGNGDYLFGSKSSGINLFYVELTDDASGDNPVGGITAPTPLTISATSDADDASKITISGTGTAGDEGSNYVVTRTDAASKTKDMKVAGNAESFTVNDTLDASGTYTYTVKGTGKNADGDETATTSDASAEIVYTLPLGKAKPAVIPGNGSIRVSWSAVKEATSYDVKVYQNGTELTDKALTNVTDTSVAFEGLTNGTEYGFVVVTNRSTTATDKQTTSDEVKATPVAPEVGVTWLNASDLETNASFNNTIVVNDMFSLVGGGSELRVTACNPVVATDGQTFTKRIETRGTGNATGPARAIQITLTTDSYIIAYAQSSGSGRPLVLADESGQALEQIALVANTADVEPSRAISLKAGTYYLYTTGGGGYVYGVKVGEGEAPRAEWSTVANPVIESVTRNDDGTVTVKFDAVFGTDGADSGYVFMYQDGFEVASATVSSNSDVVFTPAKEGTFTFNVVITRAGEADKTSETVTLDGYTLPLVKPTITWVNNLGNGSVYVDWNNIEADSFDVAVKSEADADFANVVTGLTAGNYTLTNLIPGLNYEVKVTATKEGLVSSDTASFTVGDAVQQWYATLMGSATSGTITVNGTDYSMKAAAPVLVEDVTNTDGKVVLKCNADGKIADSEDGILYYFTKINPNTENFKLSATFTVTDTSLEPDNQTGYGIYATDIAGYGSKDDKYFNSVSVGQFKMFGGFYHAHGARLITGYTSYDASNNAGALRNHDNTNLFSLKNELDKVNVGDTFTYTLEKTNEGYVASVTGAGETILFEGATSIMEQEDGSICVGVAAARKVTVEVSNITFEKSEGNASAAAGVNEIVPKVTVFSGSVSGTTDYEFIAAPNVDGWLDVFNFATNEYVYQGPVYTDKVVKVPVTLKFGYNDIKYAFKGSEDIPNLSTYQIIENTISVAVQQWGAEGETIYVAPNASSGAAGTREEPLDLQTALNHAQPGQTIVMLDGTYYIEKDLVIPRSVNGTADKMITLTAENVGSVVIDGSKMEASSSLINMVGSYWHMYGIEFQNGLGKGVSVCGNHNIVELCTIHNVSNSGLQISRYAGEPNDSNMWPSYNLVKYCEAYDCCDPGKNDADGFAAKLTCGEGNKFYGCISHHNIDDGWDLYAKSTTGPIGAVTIENCVAYSNGFLTTDDPSTMSSSDFGEGNGFKLGGENMPGAHILKNSISYNNAGKGITSNSGPDCQVINCTAFNNSLKGGTYSVSLYTKTSNPKAWVLEGMLSIAENGTTAAELGSSNGVIYSLRSETNYLFDGSKSVNNQGVQATSDWFVSTDITLVPTITVNGIDMHGLLELKDQSLNAGAKFTSWEASAKPEATKTVSTKNVISFVGFNSVALGQAGSVKTGDTTPIASLLAIMVISAGICGAYVFRRKKSF